MTEDVILVERDGPVATVALNRPQTRNALSTRLRKALWPRRQVVTERARSQV